MNKATTIILIIVIFYAAFLFTYLQEIDEDYFFLGPRYLIVEDNYINLDLNRSFNSLELRFVEPAKILNNSYKIKISGDKNEYSFPTSQANNILFVYIPDSLEIKPFSKVQIIIYFANISKSTLPIKRKIKQVIFDKQQIGLSDFYINYLDRDKSNIIYFKALYYKNLSNFLAEQYGVSILNTLIVFLFVLFITQITILLLTFSTSILKKDTIVENKLLVFLDGISRDYAIFLGFLGTVISIWISLELIVTDYTDFFQILDIIKSAIFTTVEGLLVTAVYYIRDYISKIENISNER